jgi:BirA family biotin operon repressor/biotin-[acetyl-CoA-carboxylase] ligase
LGAAPAASAIADALALAWPGECSVEAVVVTESTNADMAARARTQQPAIRILRAADFQSCGRGRQNRRWHAAPGDALLFSAAIPLAGASPPLPAITLACGVALAECLRQLGIAVQLKWPNDIRVEGRKLGGILTELVTDRNARHTLVIGVGVNLRLDRAVRGAIDQPAVALEQLLAPAVRQSREHWIGRLAGAIFAAADSFDQLGFDFFRERFNVLLESRGEIVCVNGAGVAPISGRVIEVDRHGRLILEADGRRHVVSVGDVSVRR